MPNCLYVDGILQVHFINGMVRIDLFRLESQQSGEPSKDKVEQLLLTPEGLVSTLNTLRKVEERMIAAGILPKK